MVSPQRPAIESTGLWTRLTNLTMRRFKSVPVGGRAGAITWVALMGGVVGWIDFQTGTRVSLTLLYLIPVTLALVWMGLTAGWLTAVMCVAMRLSADLLDEPDSISETWLWWNSGGSLFVYLAVVWALHSLLELHRELERRVRERTAELEAETLKRQQVQRDLLELSANERSAMGRELHDQLGQHLVGTAMAAQVLAHRMQARDETAAREARQIADLVEQGIAQTRQLARGLMLERVDPERLKSEIEELCATLQQQFPRVVCDAFVQTPARLRDAASAAQIYRIAQEGMRNACRHSGGKRVRLGLRELDDRVVLSIEDDGKGLPAPDQRAGGLGLRIMQHRADILRSKLSVDTQTGRGTRIYCEIPLE